MRLYPYNAPRTVIDHPVWGHFEADPDHGGFDLPDELSDELHPFHYRGKPIWETEDEKSLRERTDDLGRRRDPAALYDAVGGFTSVVKQMATALAPAAPAAPVDRDEEIAALRRRLAELEAPAGDGKPPARRKIAASGSGGPAE
jgi:hypothetical protein